MYIYILYNFINKLIESYSGQSYEVLVHVFCLKNLSVILSTGQLFSILCPNHLSTWSMRQRTGAPMPEYPVYDNVGG